MEDRHVYLGRCHSRAWFEPWLQLGALSPTTRPTGVMQLPCIKSRAPCNLQTENKERTLVSATVQQFDVFFYWFLSSPKILKLTISSAMSGDNEESCTETSNICGKMTSYGKSLVCEWRRWPLLSHRCIFIWHLWTLELLFAPAWSPSMDTLWAGTKGLFSAERSRHEGKSQLRQPQRGLVCECPSGGAEMAEMLDTHSF